MPRCFSVLIPARSDSKRFPRKLYVLIRGKSVIEHTYEAAISSDPDQIVIVCKDAEMDAFCQRFNAVTFLTDGTEINGTEACAQAAIALDLSLDTAIVVLQGDEWATRASDITTLASAILPDEVATLVFAAPRAPKNRPSNVKVVVGSDARALYFSRLDIPFERTAVHTISKYIHIGMYGLTARTLLRYPLLEQPPIELAEGLEQLRWLDHHVPIRYQLVDPPAHSAIDVAEDMP